MQRGRCRNTFRIGLNAVVPSVLLIGLFGLASCDSDDEKLRDLTPCDRVSFDACDVYSEDCQARVYRLAECARDYEGEGYPRVNELSVDEYRMQLEASLSGDDDDDDASAQRKRVDRMVTTAFQMMGLFPEDVESVGQANIDEQVSSTLAYYSLATKEVTIINHGKPSDSQILRENTLVLGHEFTHAQQDEAHNLLELGQTYFDDSTDAYYAWRSLVEGEARFAEVLIESVSPEVSINEDALLEYIDNIEVKMRELALDPELSYATSLRYIPYTIAFNFIAQSYLADGLDGIHSHYERPRTTILDYMRTPDAAPASAADISWSWTHADEDEPLPLSDRMGAWVLYSLLGRNGVEDSAAWDLARTWRSDSLLIHADDKGEHVSILWRISLHDSSPEQQDVLATQLQNADFGGTRRVYVASDDLVFAVVEDESDMSAWIERADAMLRRRASPSDLPTARIPRRFTEPGGPYHGQ